MKKELLSKLTHYTWDLAYFNFDYQDCESFDLNKLHYIYNPYRTKWFADPFILSDDENMFQLLVEEYDNSINRGRIAKLIVDKKSDKIIDCKIVLDLPTHLSFPVIYRECNETLVHPENSASGASFMYEYDNNSNRLVNPICILNEPVTDAIIRKENGKYMLYATRLPDPNGNVLRLYVSDYIKGPYSFIAEDIFDHNTARMAGGFIKFKGKQIRPAQDCCGAYGKAVVFYDGHDIISRLAPSGMKYSGIHTFNTHNNLGVVDLKKWDYPGLVAVKDSIKKFLRMNRESFVL